MPYTYTERFVIGLFAFFLLAALAIGIAALILVTQKPSSTAAFMARTSATAQSLTGMVPGIVLFDTLVGTSSGFTYADGKFTATKAGIYTMDGNVAINVSDTGGGGSTLGPMTVWVKKDNSEINYAAANFEPIDLSFVAGNSQYITWSTTLRVEAGEAVWVNVVSATDQQILAGPFSYVSIGTPLVTC